jgi:hypothetical protein
MTTPIQSAKGIPPHAYTSHLERTMARAENEYRHRRRRAMMLRALIGCALATVVVLAAWIRFA